MTIIYYVYLIYIYTTFLIDLLIASIVIEIYTPEHWTLFYGLNECGSWNHMTYQVFIFQSNFVSPATMVSSLPVNWPWKEI